MKKTKCSDCMFQQIGSIVRSRRVSRNMTQESLAEAIGKSRNFISMLENGRKAASIETYYSISHNLGMRLQDLFIEKESETVAEEILILLEGCSGKEVSAIIEIIRTIKNQITQLR